MSNHPMSRSNPRRIVLAVLASVVVAAAAVCAVSGSDARRSSNDALLQTIADTTSALAGQPPRQLVTILGADGRRAAIFHSDGDPVAGDTTLSSPAARLVAQAGHTVLQAGPDQTVATARLGNGDVVVVRRPGSPTPFEAATTSRSRIVLALIVVGLIGMAIGRLTARRADERGGGPVTTPTAQPPRYRAPDPPDATRPAAPVDLRPPTPPPPEPAHAAPVEAETGAAGWSPVAPASGVEELARRYLQLVDSATSPALHREAADALAAAGFELTDPTGDLFDPTRHFAAGRRATADPSLHNHIAETIRLGCYGVDRVIREAEVVVYRTDAGGGQ